MKNLVSRTWMTIAAAGLVFSPIAAQANTRAGDNGAIYSGSALSQPGLARGATGAALANNDAEDIAPIILGILGGALVIIAIIIIDDDDDQSPGT